MSTLRRKLHLSVHPDIIDRNVTDHRHYAVGWKNADLTPEELVQSINNGHPYCARMRGHRDKKHFQGSDIVSLDIDEGLGIEEALQNPIVAAHATILYTTVRHQPFAPRFRIIFVLPRTIMDGGEMEAVVRALRLRVAGDRKAVDPARMYFGNRNADVRVFDREMSAELLDELIAQGLNGPEPDTVGAAGGKLNCVPSRSGLFVVPDQEVRTAKGEIHPFSDLELKTTIHCPFHNDRHPSAVVVANRNDIKGIFCSTCGCTYWPEDSTIPADEVFDSFEKTVREAAAYYEAHRDYGPLGPMFGFPESSDLTGSTIRIVSGRATPSTLKPGLIMVRSPKGSGKTARLTSLIRSSPSVLLIGHRRALIRQTCQLLELHCYLDDEGRPNTDQHPRYGICLDSLAKIPPRSRFDTVILDESEQVLAHFLSETMDRKSGSRDRIFVEFRRLIRQAKTVIALDADLGWVTFRTLSRLDDRKAKHIWINEAKPGHATIQVFESEAHLVAELKKSIAGGRRCFVTSNAKGKIDKLAMAIKDEFPGKNVISITSDTVGQEKVRQFIEAPGAVAIKYDVIFASPSIGTGVDIAFPDQARVIDVVFGFFEAQITTHLDFDQQLARVRHPGTVKVWVNPRRFQFETEFDVVKRDALERSLFKNLLVGYTDLGEPEYDEADIFLEMASLILSEQRASKNNLKANFIRHKEKQGFVIEHVQKDQDLFAQGRGILAKGKRLNDESYCRAILLAKDLTPGEFTRITEALRAGERVSEADRLSYEKSSLQLFYQEPVSDQLIAQDDRGRFRAKVRLFESVFQSPDLTELNFQSFDRGRFVMTESSRAITIMTLLRLTPLLNGNNLDSEIVIQQSDLTEFANTLVKQKAVIETHLGIQVRLDVKSKPLQQLGSILKLVGLRLESGGSKKRKGQKLYQYRLEAKSLAKMKVIVGNRDKSESEE